VKVILRDILTQETVKNQNKILLQLGLQTWEIPSNPILRNKTGKIMVKKVNSNGFV